MIFGYFRPPGHQKSNRHRPRNVKKNTMPKTLSRTTLFVKNLIFIQKVTSKGDPRPGGTNHDFHNFFALGPPGAPQERPRVPKVSPRVRRGAQSEPKRSGGPDTREDQTRKNACASNPATHPKARWRGRPAGPLDKYNLIYLYYYILLLIYDLI